ncbi:MAG TPA: sigma-70 family RNA polymerase sigma factor [Tepidisphaeraceae bacterium]|jgi:RNA polymerase sigma-70 factor (ECF subfamily)
MANPKGNPLVTSLANGDPEGYSALYERLAAPLLRMACSMLKDLTEAEDVVHDVFIELVRNRHRLTHVEDLDAYVFAMLRHVILRRLKRRHNERDRLRQLAMIPQSEPVAETSDDLMPALASLPIEQQEVIAMKINSELTFAQIADILHVSPNTAASRYRYALEKLRRALE